MGRRERHAAADIRDVQADVRDARADLREDGTVESRADRADSKLDRTESAVDRLLVEENVPEAPTPEQFKLLLRSALRERRFMYASFAAIAISLGLLQWQVWQAADRQQHRCDERNRVAEAVIKYLPPTVNKQVVIEEAGLPLDCSVYE